MHRVELQKNGQRTITEENHTTRELKAEQTLELARHWETFALTLAGGESLGGEART